MKKGMFYLLPLLVLCQVATSTPHRQVDENTVLTSTGTDRAREAPVTSLVNESRVAPTVATITAPGLVAVRPVSLGVPRSGRNNRHPSANRILIRR